MNAEGSVQLEKSYSIDSEAKIKFVGILEQALYFVSESELKDQTKIQHFEGQNAYQLNLIWFFI